ncbi:MAG: type II toxin-antitoxin system VapC family toxin [Candidatus Eremiobacterota bacterium]
MILVDLNLLVYAVNRDAPDHKAALAWWEDCLSGDEPVALAWSVVLGFLRVSTLPALPRPLCCEDALKVVDDWLKQPVVVLLHPSDRHWDVLRELLIGTGTAGNLTSDAHLAALAMEYGAVLYSSDNDFRRFEPELRFRNPLQRKR